MKNLVLLFTVLVFVGGCKKENPYVDPGPVTPAVTANNVAFIFNNDVYFMNDISGSPVQITVTSAQQKTMIRMSHDHSKFAYKNAAGIIEIVNASGTPLDTLSQFTSVKDFNWSSDDATLYILSGSQILYYGPSMSLPSISYPGVPITATKWVESMSVSAANDLAYVIQYQDFSGSGSLLVIKPHDGSPTLTRSTTDVFLDMAYVRFSINATDMVVGYTQVSSGDPDFTRIEMFSGLSTTPTRSWESSEQFNSPVYRSDLNLVTCAYDGASSSSNMVVATRDLNLTPEESTSLTYVTRWVDWK